MRRKLTFHNRYFSQDSNIEEQRLQPSNSNNSLSKRIKNRSAILFPIQSNHQNILVSGLHQIMPDGAIGNNQPIQGNLITWGSEGERGAPNTDLAQLHEKTLTPPSESCQGNKFSKEPAHENLSQS